MTLTYQSQPQVGRVWMGTAGWCELRQLRGCLPSRLRKGPSGSWHQPQTPAAFPHTCGTPKVEVECGGP